MRLGNIEFRPGLIPTIIFLLVLPLLLGLGNWQLNRAAEKQQLDAERLSKESGELLDLNLLGKVNAADHYLPARVSGHYLDNRYWLLDNQVANGRIGYHVFSLLKMEGQLETYLLVNRGWVPLGQDRAVLPQINTPAGRVTLQGRLDTPASVGMRVGEVDYVADRVLPFLDIQDLGKTLTVPLLKYALVLDEGQAGLLQRDWEQAAEMTAEKHVGYAVQWFALAFALAVIYIGVNSRKIRQDDDPEENAGSKAGHE